MSENEKVRPPLAGEGNQRLADVTYRDHSLPSNFIIIYAYINRPNPCPLSTPPKGLEHRYTYGHYSGDSISPLET